MKLTLLNHSYHRNGISGAPFEVVIFRDQGEEASLKLAILFEASHHCAVLDIARLAAGDIAFGSNSWRGDTYEPALRRLLREPDGRTAALAGLSGRDLHALLATQREIAVIWTIGDVQCIRRDLNDEQAWRVLQAARRHHDATIGINWDVLGYHAESLFGDAPSTDSAEEV